MSKLNMDKNYIKQKQKKESQTKERKHRKYEASYTDKHGRNFTSAGVFMTKPKIHTQLVVYT